MKKLNVEEIKKELVNEEMSFIDLDNFMMESGYYSVFDDGATENIKQDKNVVYTATDSNECEVQSYSRSQQIMERTKPKKLST